MCAVHLLCLASRDVMRVAYVATFLSWKFWLNCISSDCFPARLGINLVMLLITKISVYDLTLPFFSLIPLWGNLQSGKRFSHFHDRKVCPIFRAFKRRLVSVPFFWCPPSRQSPSLFSSLIYGLVSEGISLRSQTLREVEAISAVHLCVRTVNKARLGYICCR